MICRLRARSGLYLSVLLLLAGVSLTARATQPVTRSEMESFVYVTLAVGAGALIGAVWTLLSYHLGRLERMFEKGVERLDASQSRGHDALRAHNEDPLAHASASEHNHGPMNAQLDRLEEQLTATANKLDALIRDHDRIQRQEGDLCHALEEIRHRNPADSPKPRRASDSGTDYTALRGRE